MKGDTYELILNINHSDGAFGLQVGSVLSEMKLQIKRISIRMDKIFGRLKGFDLAHSHVGGNVVFSRTSNLVIKPDSRFVH